MGVRDLLKNAADRPKEISAAGRRRVQANARLALVGSGG